MFGQYRTLYSPLQGSRLYRGWPQVVGPSLTRSTSYSQIFLRCRGRFRTDETRCLSKWSAGASRRKVGTRLTRYQHIFVVRHEILKNLARAIDNVDVPPVNPGMLWFEGRIEQVVSCSSNGFSSWTLSGKAMPLFHVHLQDVAEVLLHNQRAMEWYLVRPLLDPIQLRRQNGQSVIRRIPDEESKIDEVMGVGEVRQ